MNIADNMREVTREAIDRKVWLELGSEYIYTSVKDMIQDRAEEGHYSVENVRMMTSDIAFWLSEEGFQVKLESDNTYTILWDI